MEANLGFLIKRWYMWRKTLDDFPFGLIGCMSVREFYSCGLPFIVPLHMAEKDLTNLERVSTGIGKSIQDMVEVSHTFRICNLQREARISFLILNI